MVRVVFCPYAQVWRSICPSESPGASTRVSSGYALPKHSSPSFRSQQVCCYSNLSSSKIGRSMMRLSLRDLTSPASSLYFDCTWDFITLSLAHMLESLDRFSRRVGWDHMTANILGTVWALFPTTACLSSSASKRRTTGRGWEEKLSNNKQITNRKKKELS